MTDSPSARINAEQFGRVNVEQFGGSAEEFGRYAGSNR
jgi:hypothetical protein